MKYGSREVTLKLERETTRLVHREPSVNASPDKFRKLLATHLPFSGRRVSNVGIVVADKTRLCQYSTYLPVLTGYLQESGIPPSGITFYIAYGTHAPQSEQECIESYGETYKQFRFVHHNSRDTGAFQALGTTSRGTSVKVAREVLQHDMLITFGAILHHYFAGYGGGRKLLFPGMGAYESILQNHRLFLDYKTRSPAAGCLSGQLDHNPLALDLEEISGMLPPHLEIYTILDSQKQVCEISAGTSYEEFRKVCQRYDLFFKSTEMQQFDLVVASAGGYPKDINFIQSHKSIQNAASFVKNGGKLIIFAECRDGIGNPGLMGLFRLGGKDNIFRELEVEYKNNAGTAISMLEKAERMEIRMVTTLSEEDCRFMGATRCLPEDVQHMIDSEKGSVAVLENAGMLYR
jgi:nickel-dependent lactate racemase